MRLPFIILRELTSSTPEMEAACEEVKKLTVKYCHIYCRETLRHIAQFYEKIMTSVLKILQLANSMKRHFLLNKIWIIIKLKKRARTHFHKNCWLDVKCL